MNTLPQVKLINLAHFFNF